ncbi:sensor histidine kinase [Ramlibacter sp. MMS24-I3-19]|uniref:sensor histidine kinase n=1 Tax=Ramlibacter sp. MMS24-I3-19 TaxID=3416606 RepID=UPI003CFBC81E
MTQVSLRRYLLVGILLPVLALIVLNGVSLYRTALAALNTAYDRTLLASAKEIGEQLDVEGFDENADLRATVPYAALDTFESDNRTRMFYRVSNLHGELVSGFADLPVWHGSIPARPPYAALVQFYDDRFRGDDVRVAALLQPVATPRGRGMAVVQVAETLELRRGAARQILLDALWRQGLLVLVIALVVVVVVQRAIRPVRGLSEQLQARREGDLTPIEAPRAPRELEPLVQATNGLMRRLAELLEHQQVFVRDAAHQLRTPLAVLKTQVQSALRGDVEPQQALVELNATVDRATALANQMLSLAKVEQLRQQDVPVPCDLAQVARDIALDLSPLVAERDLDFAIATEPAPVQAHDWMLRELTRNLLHNAVRHSAPGAPLSVRVAREGRWCTLTVSDAGPGIDAALRQRLFQPFASGDVRTGSGLGLAICHRIVQALGGTLVLDNRTDGRRVTGLDATARLPLATMEADGQIAH